MSKVDDVFDFADELVDEWGHYVTLVRKENSVYDPETGSVTETETRLQVKVVICKLDINELRRSSTKPTTSRSSSTQSKSTTSIITEQDYFLIPRENAPDEHMKIIKPTTYRGERPVAYVIHCRPQ